MLYSDKFIVGIDEVGRGPLAGPVTVCAFALPKSTKWFKSVKLPLRDSKKLSASQREAWLKEINKAVKRGEAVYATRSVGVKIIDKINIRRAADLAATRAFQALLFNIPKNFKIVPYETILKNGDFAKLTDRLNAKVEVILDGGLRINLPGVRQRSLPKADENFPAVSLASIAAKVKRDRYMGRLDRAYPGYGFGVHKGYGASAHYRAIKKLGPSAVHRLTFLGNFGKFRHR